MVVAPGASQYVELFNGSPSGRKSIILQARSDVAPLEFASSKGRPSIKNLQFKLRRALQKKKQAGASVEKCEHIYMIFVHWL